MLTGNPDGNSQNQIAQLNWASKDDFLKLITDFWFSEEELKYFMGHMKFVLFLSSNQV